LFIFKLLIKTLTSHLLLHRQIVHEVLIVPHLRELPSEFQIQVLFPLLLVVYLLELIQVLLQLLFRLLLVPLAQLFKKSGVVVVWKDVPNLDPGLLSCKGHLGGLVFHYPTVVIALEPVHRDLVGYCRHKDFVYEAESRKSEEEDNHGDHQRAFFQFHNFAFLLRIARRVQR
jgi:hypothetical protein